MTITTKQNQNLRAKAHHLKPVIICGNKGLTDAVMEEIKLAIAFHELVKIKLNAENKETHQKMVDDIITNCACHHVQSIGRVGIFYKASDENKINLNGQR